MKVHLNRRYRFSASHRLHQPEFSSERNLEVYGKCNNPYGHGHNYVLEVGVSGPVDPDTGMVCNLVDLDSVVEQQVLIPLNLSNLNQIPMFAEEVPTTENLCRKIYESLKLSFTAVKIERVRLEETLSNSFEYTVEPELQP